MTSILHYQEEFSARLTKKNRFLSKKKCIPRDHFRPPRIFGDRIQNRWENDAVFSLEIEQKYEETFHFHGAEGHQTPLAFLSKSRENIAKRFAFQRSRNSSDAYFLNTVNLRTRNLADLE